MGFFCDMDGIICFKELQYLPHFPYNFYEAKAAAAGEHLMTVAQLIQHITKVIDYKK